MHVFVKYLLTTASYCRYLLVPHDRLQRIYLRTALELGSNLRIYLPDFNAYNRCIEQVLMLICEAQ